VFVKFLVLLVLLVSVQSDVKPPADFSGKWSLESKNDNKVAGDKTTLVISQTGPEIKVVQESSQGGTQREFTYYADGRGETNPSESSGQPFKSVTSWKKKALIIKFSFPSTRANNNVVVNERIDEWTMSKDGQTLTQTSSFTSSSSTTDASSNPHGSPRSPNLLKTPFKWKEKRAYKRL
jgi:hypothetical protein